MGRFSLQWVDSTQERATVSYPVPDTANDGSDYAALQTANLALRDAINAVQVSPAIVTQQYVSDRVKFSPSIPTNPLCQVEQRWIISYIVDGLAGSYTEPIPCASLAVGVPQANKVILDLSIGLGLALKSAVESTFFIQEGVDAGGTGLVTVTEIYAENS